MLQVTGVSLQYGSKKLFEDVNLKFTKGIKNAYKRIAGMKTANFVKDYLAKKMGSDIFVGI